MASRRFFDGAQSELGLLPVGDGGPGDAGLTFTDPSLFYEPFTGTNGAAWDSDWTEVYNGSTTVTIQSNKGRMAVPAADGAIYWADTVTLPTDYEIRVAIVGSADRDARVYFGTEFMTGGFSGNGHFVKLDSAADTLTLGTVVGYTDSTPVGSTTYTHAGTDTTYLHIKVRGTSCKIRAWKNSEDEPLSWQLTGTLTYTFDEVHLGAFGVGSTCNVDFDDLYVWTTRPLATGTDTSWAGSGDLVVLKHSHPTWTGDVKAIIWKHGGIGAAAANVDDWTLYPELIADGNGRFILYAADDGFGGNGAAGNDTELASLDAVYARAQTDYPEFPKVALAAHSLGGMGIVNWAYRNTSDVAGMIGVDVILDAAQMETDTGDFITNVLDPAYGGTGTWATNASTRDPQDLATASAALRAIPFEIYDATGDSVLTSAVIDNYATAHGANATVTDIASGDHGTVHNFIDVDALITEIQTWDFTAPSTLDAAGSTSSLTVTAQSGTLSGAGTANISGNAASLTVTAQSGTLSGAGAADIPGNTTSLTVTAQSGTLSGAGTADIPGNAASLTLAAQTGTVTGTGTADISGNTASLTVTAVSGTAANAAGGDQDISANTASLTVTAQSGTLAGTGDATLAGSTSSLTVTAQSGTLTGTGTADIAGNTASITVTAQAGTLTGTGTATLAGSTASLTVTGTSGTLANLTPGNIDGSTASLVVTAQSGTLSGEGTATIAGSAATLTVTGTSGTLGGAGAADIPGNTATLVVTAQTGTLVGAGTANRTGSSAQLVLTAVGGALFGDSATITGRLRTRRADVARTTGRGDTARTTRRSDTPRTTRGDGR